MTTSIPLQRVGFPAQHDDPLLPGAENCDQMIVRNLAAITYELAAIRSLLEKWVE